MSLWVVLRTRERDGLSGALALALALGVWGLGEGEEGKGVECGVDGWREVRD